MVEQKQTVKRINRFIRIGRFAYLIRFGDGITKAPGSVVNARGVFTQLGGRFYRFRPLPRNSLSVLTALSSEDWTRKFHPGLEPELEDMHLFRP